MTLIHLFQYTVMTAILLWIIAIFSDYFFKWKFSFLIKMSASLLIFFFLCFLWWDIQRPPFRTLGETRLLYSFFLPLAGYFLDWRLKLKWPGHFAIACSILFLLITFFSTENFEKELMPALQSPWFIPHVLVYILSYALFTAVSLCAVWALLPGRMPEHLVNLVEEMDRILLAALALLTMGLIFGAFWAKETWGHYWTWDPKETWALLTWLSYIFYLHWRMHHHELKKTSCWFLILNFFILLICWFGVNYLPSNQMSIHMYSHLDTFARHKFT